MKKQRPLALLVEGNASTSALFRLRHFGSLVGPVKSTSLAAARRFANTNRAGYGVATFDELQDARLLLVRVPDASVRRVVDEIVDCGFNLKRTPIVFCETWFGSETMGTLRERGAEVATITAVPSQVGLSFIAEGDVRALRLVKPIVKDGGGAFLEIRPGTKALYFAAELLVTAMPLSYLSAAQRSLREAGLSGRPLAGLLEQLAATMLRNFRAGARIAEGGPLATCLPELAADHLAAAVSKVPGMDQLLGRALEKASETVEPRHAFAGE